jgi:hypothetical protein
MKGLRGGVVAVAVAAGTLAGATSAFATDFVASPTGSGTACTDPSPCSLSTAVADANGGAVGDNAVLQPGTYTIASALGVSDGLKAETRGTHPIISNTAGVNVQTTSANAHIEDVVINTSGLTSGRALDLLAGALADRVEVIASSTVSATAVQVRGGSRILDSTVWIPSSGGTAIVGGTGGGTLTNVTAIATGGGSATGLRTFSGQPQTLTVANSIFRGTSHDINAVGTAGDNTTIAVSYSDYVTSAQSGPGAAVISPGPGNTMASPSFANASTGDFHELAGSPTIDTGFSVGGLGPFALDGQPRLIGAAPDIGADEFQPPVPVATHRRKKCKKHKRHKGHAAAASKKKCKRKRH